MPLTGLDLSDADMDTENHLFGGMFCHVVEEGGKAISPILSVPLCPVEKAIDR